MKPKRITHQIEAGKIHSDVKWHPIKEKPTNEDALLLVREVSSRKSLFTMIPASQLEAWKYQVTDWAYISAGL